VEKGVARFSVSVPPDLLKEFDEMIRLRDFDRSKAIQLAMRNLLSDDVWKYEEKGKAAGTITLIYDHETTTLEERLTDIQHHSRDLIVSTMHIHLDEQNCLLVIAIKGEISEIRDLARNLTIQRGIKQLRLVIILS
jgi:CopG family nickel-responsive transcriptional regulator